MSTIDLSRPSTFNRVLLSRMLENCKSALDGADFPADVYRRNVAAGHLLTWQYVGDIDPGVLLPSGLRALMVDSARILSVGGRPGPALQCLWSAASPDERAAAATAECRVWTNHRGAPLYATLQLIPL
jgi:hypothetical protein